LPVSTFMINHVLRHRESDRPAFRAPGFYRKVRDPFYLGFAIAFRSWPRMTASHFFFACVTTAYVLLGICFEERGLIRTETLTGSIALLLRCFFRFQQGCIKTGSTSGPELPEALRCSLEVL
jgi:protein-S-isoprenylcysteine O-methyltransferase Ste14